MEDIQEKAMQDELNPEQDRLEEKEALERHLKHIRERVRKAETDEENEHLFDVIRDAENRLDILTK